MSVVNGTDGPGSPGPGSRAVAAGVALRSAVRLALADAWSPEESARILARQVPDPTVLRAARALLARTAGQGGSPAVRRALETLDRAVEGVVRPGIGAEGLVTS